MSDKPAWVLAGLSKFSYQNDDRYTQEQWDTLTAENERLQKALAGAEHWNNSFAEVQQDLKALSGQYVELMEQKEALQKRLDEAEATISDMSKDCTLYLENAQSAQAQLTTVQLANERMREALEYARGVLENPSCPDCVEQIPPDEMTQALSKVMAALETAMPHMKELGIE